MKEYILVADFAIAAPIDICCFSNDINIMHRNARSQPVQTIRAAL